MTQPSTGQADNAGKPVAAPGAPAAFGSSWAWVRFLLLAAAGVAGDLALKAYAFPTLQIAATRDVFESYGIHPESPPQPIIPGVLGFQTTVNFGAVFGLGQGWGWLFVVFSLVAIAAIVGVFARSRANQWVTHIALALILAGALGNLYDRVVYGAVRDMLRFDVDWYPYIFNIADVLLCIGVPLLMLVWILQKDPESGG